MNVNKDNHYIVEKLDPQFGWQLYAMYSAEIGLHRALQSFQHTCTNHDGQFRFTTSKT